MRMSLQETQKDTEDDADVETDWSDLSASQGVPGVTSGHQELEGGLASFSLSPQKAPALLTPGFQTSGLNSRERMKSCCSELPSWWDLVTAGEDPARPHQIPDTSLRPHLAYSRCSASVCGCD